MISRRRVADAVAAVLADRPGLAVQMGDHGGGRRELPGTPASWGDVPVRTQAVTGCGRLGLVRV